MSQPNNQNQSILTSECNTSVCFFFPLIFFFAARSALNVICAAHQKNALSERLIRQFPLKVLHPRDLETQIPQYKFKRNQNIDLIITSHNMFDIKQMLYHNICFD